ncbi:[molybdopterin synthase] sulfurylase [Paraglaciecola sp. T6c]|uniref:molybdopterin-synthase adenylyltransferase MoeB n=1 Tax=Pseudoalteromonas atlantica (strain T6c / ATCC BAA-1087) TaxID=3042615 RepID=UPI00005C5EA4|nr:molybdopterin-synthase adenylyltransferase MoeB [Paraglaciecola sp. T6c]ABG41052.1 [molybdopterin synthase] sulfurylase [Paraglaciecola sp. T6c]
MPSITPPTLTKALALRYARQILLPAIDLDGQEALMGSKVLIIGVGGLGCAAAQYLVSSGIGEITLVDDDKVELSNLHRQVLHHEQDVGVKKVDSAKTSLLANNSLCVINTIDERLDDNALSQHVSQHNVVLDCTDNLATRQQINKLCFTHKVPLISGAAIRFEGQVSTYLMDNHSPCYQCLSQVFPEQQLSCMEAGVIPPLVGVIGSMQALEAIKYLTGAGELLNGILQLFDAKSSQFQRFSIPKNPQCSICSKTG